MGNTEAAGKPINLNIFPVRPVFPVVDPPLG